MSAPPAYSEKPGAPPSHPMDSQPAPGAYPQAPVGGNTTVIVTTTGGLMLGPRPVNCTCPHCQAQVVTEVSATPGMLTWIICIILLLFGCWLGCCLIPFCVDDCQDIEHRCPNCKTFLGTYKRINM